MSPTAETPRPPHRQAVGHEPETAAAGCVALAGLGLLGMVLATMLGVYWLATTWSSGSAGPLPPEQAGERLAPGTAGMPNQTLLRQRMQREERKQLTSYGCVDREQGIARVPVQRAMELLAERGLPFPAADAPSSNHQQNERQEEPHGVPESR